jgi:hypothetical protein
MANADTKITLELDLAEVTAIAALVGGVHGGGVWAVIAEEIWNALADALGGPGCLLELQGYESAEAEFRKNFDRA